MTRRYPKPLKEKLRSLYSWHRWLGVSSAVFVIWLALTGLALQHSSDLNLDQQPANISWLHKHFGTEINLPDTAIQYEGQWLSQVDNRLYFNKTMVDKGATPVGMARMGLIWAVACRETLWLLNENAEVLEKLEGLDLPGRIRSIGQRQNQLILETNHGRFEANPMSAQWPQWQPTAQRHRVTYKTLPFPDKLKPALSEQAQRYALSWSRVLLDAHSGRILGDFGVWLMDIMAITFIVLGLSGLMLWLRFRRNMKQRQRRQAERLQTQRSLEES